jgi:hypothetical protein
MIFSADYMSGTKGEETKHMTPRSEAIGFLLTLRHGTAWWRVVLLLVAIVSVVLLMAW